MTGLSDTGVRLTDGTELRSDLLVDATGPSTIVPKALEEAGLGAVPVERVLSDTTYCGCIMEAPPGYQVHPPPMKVKPIFIFKLTPLSLPFFSGLSWVSVMSPMSTQ